MISSQRQKNLQSSKNITPGVPPNGRKSASRSLFLDAMIDGTPKKHFVYSLNVDTGATNPNWPVDLNATVNYKGTTFTSKVQNQRGGLAIVNGVLYVPFSGHYGDCGNYRDWVVGISINDPSRVSAWATPAVGGGNLGPRQCCQ
jgi:hypothetical protein